MDPLYGFTERDLKRVVQTVLRSERSAKAGQGAAQANGSSVQWFPFRNDYSGTVPARSVMRITGATSFSSVFGGIDDQPILTCDRPNTTFYQQYAVCESQDVLTGEYGLCALSGLLEVAYDTGTPAQGEGWGPKPSQFTLSKNYPAAANVVAITDSTNKYVLCWFGPIVTVFGKTNAEIAKNATTGVVNVYSGVPGSGASIITSMQITTVHNPWETVATTKFVGVNWRNGLPCLDAREC